MKTSELTGAALDWAVAKCEGMDITLLKTPVQVMVGDINTIGIYWFTSSTNWSQGGPIIEREINVLEKRGGYWYAWRAKRNDGYVTTTFATISNSKETWAYGTTPLIAAMRCYVASKLGDTIDIPKELL